MNKFFWRKRMCHFIYLTSSKGKKKEGEKREQAQAYDYRKEEGAMTKREAYQLLNSASQEEKLLPFKGYGTGKDRYNQNYKDW